MRSIINKFRNKIVGKKRLAILLPVFLLGAGGLIAAADNANRIVPQFQIFSDLEGTLATLNLSGPTDTATNPFFQDLGTNGRRCVTCHQPSDAMSITPLHIRQRFETTQGTDPLFRTVDGANCPHGGCFHTGPAARGLQPPANQGLDSNRYRCSRKRGLPGR